MTADHIGITREQAVSINLRFVITYRGDVWTALGDPTRKAIYELLLERPRAVVELAGELPVSRPAVSHSRNSIFFLSAATYAS